MTALTLECAAVSDVGRRSNNEDAVYASRRLAAVADGVGGQAAGEVASRWIILALQQLDKCRLAQPLDAALRDAVAWGNETIGFIAECRPETAGMSTTLTAVALSNDGAYVVMEALDGRPERRATTEILAARPGDRLLLCSDGLSDVIEHGKLLEVLSACADRDDCADQLIHLALESGARDNVSAIVADVVPRTDLTTGWQPALAHNA
jgi:protein phosphatase